MKKLLRKYFAFIEKFIPNQEKGTSVGLDIGMNSCKMVEIKSTGQSFELVNWASEPVVNDDKQKAIKNVLSKTSIPVSSPKTAVFGQGTLIRYIEMPQMSEEDLNKSFALEADKYFPFPKDQVYMDCSVLNVKSDVNKMSVLIAAVKREVIDERIRMLSGLGLQADFISLNSMAIANVVSVLGLKDTDSSDDSQAVVILDMGEMISNVTILRKGLPWFTRDIFIGGKDFTRSISSVMEISFEEAEKLKNCPGDKLADVLKASESVILNLVSELRLSCDYFVTERNTTISQLILTGGATMMEGLADLFSQYLEINVQKWNPMEFLDAGSDISKEEIMKSGGKFGVALGLALYR